MYTEIGMLATFMIVIPSSNVVRRTLDTLLKGLTAKKRKKKKHFPLQHLQFYSSKISNRKGDYVNNIYSTKFSKNKRWIFEIDLCIQTEVGMLSIGVLFPQIKMSVTGLRVRQWKEKNMRISSMKRKHREQSYNPTSTQSLSNSLRWLGETKILKSVSLWDIVLVSINFPPKLWTKKKRLR